MWHSCFDQLDHGTASQIKVTRKGPDMTDLDPDNQAGNRESEPRSKAQWKGIEL